MKKRLEEKVNSIFTILALRERLPEYRELKIKKVLPHLQRAIEKISEGSHGSCDDCGDAIPQERLSVAPGAIRCVTCQTLFEKIL